LTKKVLVKDLTIRILIEKVEELSRRVKELEEENKIIVQENSILKSEVADLRARLESNSHNSNKPPSSDGYKKRPVNPAFPKTKGGKQGGQKGHKGHTLQQVENPDKIVSCTPGKCICGHKFTEDQLELAEKRQVFDIPEPKLDVTEYQLYKASCPKCGRLQTGTAPDGVNAPTQYGNKVKAFSVLLNVHYKLPYKKIQSLFNDLFGYPINESTIYSSGEKCYEKLEESEEIIKSKIIASNVVHADETGLRVEGKLQWMHTATTRLYTYLFVHPRRGAKAIQGDKSILDKIGGWLVHDCWYSYFNLPGKKHAICGAHILRELEGLVETRKTKWAKVFKSFLMGIYLMPFEESVKLREIIESKYDRICMIGKKAEPPPVKTKGRQKRTEGRNLVERLIREKDHVLAFAFNKEVPFTNNLAERDIRPARIKQKISNSFRTFKGAEIYARIEGFISTSRKNQCNAFKELCTTFEGYNFITNL